MTWIKGLHHITGAATNGQADHDFYTGVLGLRMVKKTVNHETGDQYHFFYGDQDGNAGTIMTNFIMENVPLPPYQRGRGSLTEVAYSIPPGSLEYWRDRLADAGTEPKEIAERFGDRVLAFADLSGIPSELIESADDPRTPPALSGVTEGKQIRGFHSVSAISRILELSLGFFGAIGLEGFGTEGDRTRLGLKDGNNGWIAGSFIDLVDEPEAPWGRWGLGGIHHAAFHVESKERMEQLWRVLSGSGLILTDLRDRKYFHSMYLTEPGGINIEFSNLAPGWTVDEPADSLGSILSLPSQWEPHRAEIEGKLPPFNFDKGTLDRKNEAKTLGE